MKVAFYTPHMCLRGTTVALFDYAKYNEEILGNDSWIVTDEQHVFHDDSVFDKFEQKFPSRIVRVKNEQTIDPAIIENSIDAIYIIKPGRRDKRMASACKTLIHVIGPTHPSEKHGSVWAYASKWLNNYCSGGTHPMVPYMIEPPKDTTSNLRSELGIPQDATVFGRTGGKETFDIPWVNNAILAALNADSNLYFVFQNTDLSIAHERIKVVKSTADFDFKEKFINTCDAMLHARSYGESFGVACGEFGVRGKPVFTFARSRERNHIDVLGTKGFLYNNQEELYSKMIAFDRNDGKDYYTYLEYSPENVMQIFKQVFLD